MTLPWGFALQDIPMEVHVFHGGQDLNVPLPIAQYMSTVIPRCRPSFYPDEGHLLVFTKAAEVFGALTGRGSGGGAGGMGQAEPPPRGDRGETKAR